MIIETFDDAEAVGERTAQVIAAAARDGIGRHGRAVLAFSGGSTPAAMLRRLGAMDVKWNATHVVQVDERVAPDGHPDRNWTMITNNLLAGADIPHALLHPMPVNDEDLRAAAERYERLLTTVSGVPPIADPPPGWRDPGKGIDALHHTWRYCVVWPSVHPDLGTSYRWVDGASGEIMERVPTLEDLAWLPQPWVDHCGTDTGPADKADIDDERARAWFATLAPGPICRTLRSALDAYLEDVAGHKGSRHDTALLAVARLLRIAEMGHRGGHEVLTSARGAFLAAATADGDGQCGEREAVAEWRRMVTGAIAILIADPTPEGQRGCCGARLVEVPPDLAPPSEVPPPRCRSWSSSATAGTGQGAGTPPVSTARGLAQRAVRRARRRHESGQIMARLRHGSLRRHCHTVARVRRGR
jgi:hypothetical protein